MDSNELWNNDSATTRELVAKASNEILCVGLIQAVGGFSANLENARDPATRSNAVDLIVAIGDIANELSLRMLVRGETPGPVDWDLMIPREVRKAIVAIPMPD